jgi:predicted metal-dependent TIM-barrel fold hydrolase
MIDTHTHADSRSSEDFDLMYTSGIDTAITCSFYPYKLRNQTCLINHFDRILEYDTKRAQKYGLKLEVALGLHPANVGENNDEIYEEIRKLVDENKIVAIGEIGLDENTHNEQKAFKKQLEIAEETKTKVIVHTPRKNKKEVLVDIKKIIDETINPKLVVIDHINPKVVTDVIDGDYTLGLTVQPQKMDVEDAVYILDNYGFDKFLLNSDISNKPSDPISVPKTVRTLKKLDYKNSEIEKVAYKNAKKFFKI